MRPTIDLLRHERRAAVFFGALMQSALGTGAGYVALLLIAYDRYRSPWAISLVLAADLLPAMLLGPIFGAAADRFSRRTCTVAADALRAAAFIGIASVDSFGATVALALLAGVGTGLFTPAGLAALPSLVERRRLPAATALYGAIADLGFTAGPAIAAGMLLLGGPETIMLVNGATFAVSALVLASLRFGNAPGRAGRRSGRRAPSLLGDAREGMRAAAGLRGIRTVLVASSVALFFAGAFNVGELLFITDELGAGQSGFSLLVALFGAGFIVGSLAGSRGGALPDLKRSYLLGLVVMGAGFLASGFAPSIGVAAFTFTLAGLGNGLVLVYERLLIQASVPDRLAGRVFGVKDALTAWAFALAFVAAAALIGLTGVRTVIVIAGAGGILAWGATVLLLRSVWNEDVEGPRGPRERRFQRAPAAAAAVSSGVLAGDADALRQGVTSQDGADLVGSGDHWLAILDDLLQRGDDARVELGARVPG